MVFPIEIEQVDPGSRKIGLNANREPVVEALLLDEAVELVDAVGAGELLERLAEDLLELEPGLMASFGLAPALNHGSGVRSMPSFFQP